jgi:DNA repair protein RecO (recombination protein O)
MEWRDRGIILTVRPHGETSAIVEALTEAHGRHTGVVRGGVSRKLRPVLQPGAMLDLAWHARLAEHIGTFVVEPLGSRVGAIMADRAALAGLGAVTALLSFVLAEREPHPRLFAATRALIDHLGEDRWPVAYLHWEVALLEELGFALDLSECAATGASGPNADLAFVSPKSGRAVSREGARGYEARLLPLPAVLADPRRGDPAGVVEALVTTGHFLTEGVAKTLVHKPLPAARQRLIDVLGRS